MLCNILLVENNDFAVRALTLLLKRREGFEIDTAPDLNSAFEKLRSTKVQYDCISLDLGLDDVVGVETVRRVVERTNTPVIVFTAEDSDEMKEECLQAGAAAFVRKHDMNSADALANAIVDIVGKTKPIVLWSMKPLLAQRQFGREIINWPTTIAAGTAVIINAMLVVAFITDYIEQLPSGHFELTAWEYAVMIPALGLMVKYIFTRRRR